MWTLWCLWVNLEKAEYFKDSTKDKYSWILIWSILAYICNGGLFIEFEKLIPYVLIYFYSKSLNGFLHGVALFCPTRTSIFKSRSFLSKGIYNPLPLVENAEGEPDSMKSITNHFSVIKGWSKSESHSVLSDSFETPWTVACKAPLSMEFCRQEYWSGLPCPSLGDLPNSGTKLRSPTLWVDSY